MSNLLCFHDFFVLVLFYYTQLQNADILQLVVDSAVVFMYTYFLGVISEKNTYGHIPHHLVIIFFSPRSLNGILQVVMHVGTQTRRQTPNRIRTVQMSLIILRDHHQSSSSILIWKDIIPMLSQIQLCNFVINMAQEIERQGQILFFLAARSQKSETLCFEVISPLMK